MKMRHHLLYIALLMSINVFANDSMLLIIPTDCEKSDLLLSNTPTPNDFLISPKQALTIASEQSFIKKCASKLEQAIYINNDSYIFINTVYIKNGSISTVRQKAIVNGQTGKISVLN